MPLTHSKPAAVSQSFSSLNQISRRTSTCLDSGTVKRTSSIAVRGYAGRSKVCPRDFSVFGHNLNILLHQRSNRIHGYSRGSSVCNTKYLGNYRDRAHCTNSPLPQRHERVFTVTTNAVLAVICRCSLFHVGNYCANNASGQPEQSYTTQRG